MQGHHGFVDLPRDRHGRRLAGRHADEGGGFGLLGNIIVGVIGVVIGGFLFGLLGIGAGGLIGPIITATASAAILLFIVGLIKK